MTEESGRILWTNESKYYLLRLIRDNPVIISPNVSAETMLKKELAWMSIEKCFAADGVSYQLGKIKRLWKRMKDNARTNTMKPSEQRKRGIKHLRPPSDLDWQVQALLSTRKSRQQNAAANKAKKQAKQLKQECSDTYYNHQNNNTTTSSTLRSMPKMPPNITITSANGGQSTTASLQSVRRWAEMQEQHPLQHSLGDYSDSGDGADDSKGAITMLMLNDDDDGMEGDVENGNHHHQQQQQQQQHDDNGEFDDDDDCVDLVELLTPIDQHFESHSSSRQRSNVFGRRSRAQQQPLDALEPVTIIEELKGSGEGGGGGGSGGSDPHDLTLDDDDDDDITDDNEANANDQYAFHGGGGGSGGLHHNGGSHSRSSAMVNGGRGQFGAGNGAATTATSAVDAEQRALQRELLLHDIKLRQAQRQFEEERMANERRLYQKRAQLLDLQIRRAQLDMRRAQRDVGGEADGAEGGRMEAAELRMQEEPMASETISVPQPVEIKEEATEMPEDDDEDDDDVEHVVGNEGEEVEEPADRQQTVDKAVAEVILGDVVGNCGH